ncbi:MAG: hypothetical protein HY803_11240 [candidate division NC10 bacterium]|nr:hypothetical protein [candidate division NC10 bacterium]
MGTERGLDSTIPRTCQDCAGIGRAWIEGLLQDCPECGGSGWESPVGVPPRWGFSAAPPRSAKRRISREGHA